MTGAVRKAGMSDIGPLLDPIALHIQNLFRREPIETLARLRGGALAADLEQGVTGETGIPDRRHAGLAKGLLRFHDQELVD